MEENKLEEYELKDKIIKKKTKQLLKNYVLTIVNNKNEINQNLKSEDIDIILSSGNGRKKKIFSSLSIVNGFFDAKTYSKKNEDKFNELRNLIEPLDEEGIDPFKDFEEIEFNFFPKLEKGFKFNLSSFEFKTYNEDEEIKTFDPTFFNSKYDNKKLFCVYCTKLDGVKSHKLKKIVELAETIGEHKKKFWEIFKKALIIFEVKSLEQIEKEVLNNFSMEMREINGDENQYFKDIEILFNVIKTEDEENTPSSIFRNNNYGRTFYFILNPDNYIIKIKDMRFPEDLIKGLLDIKEEGKKNYYVMNEYSINDNSLDTKINAFYNFYDFLINIKKVEYYFSLNYYFSLVLNYNQIKDKFFIKDIFFTRFNGEFRPKEYHFLKNIYNIFIPEYSELREIESIDIDIDFNDMTCIKCSKTINDKEDLFYCYICKDKYCYKCVKEHLEKNSGKNKFIDPNHNLLFFKTRDKKDLCGIDKYKLGNNTFVNADEDDLGKFGNIQCNGCGLRFATSERYICLTCKPGIKRNDGFFDYCQNCIENMMKNNEEGQKLQKEKYYVYNFELNLLHEDYTSKNHVHNTHVYLMVPLASNNTEEPYYNY